MRPSPSDSFAVVSLLLLCLYAGSPSRAGAAVFRDRAAFESAARNLHTLDFESVGRFDYWRPPSAASSSRARWRL